MAALKLGERCSALLLRRRRSSSRVLTLGRYPFDCTNQFQARQALAEPKLNEQGTITLPAVTPHHVMLRLGLANAI